MSVTLFTNQSLHELVAGAVVYQSGACPERRDVIDEVIHDDLVPPFLITNKCQAWVILIPPMLLISMLDGTPHCAVRLKMRLANRLVNLLTVFSGSTLNVTTRCYL
jgi:hypothetical protein